MRILVPLPFDVADLAHGRNLRVVNLLSELQHRAEITVLVPNSARAESLGSRLYAANICVLNKSLNAMKKDGVAWAAYSMPVRVSHGQRVRCPCHPDISSRTSVETASCSTDTQGPYRPCRSVAYFDAAPELADAIPRLANECDAILGFDLSSAAALLAAKSASPDTPAIIDLIDDPWLTWRSTPWLSRITKTGLTTVVALRQVRRMLLAQMDAVITAGQRDAMSLCSSKTGSIEVVANGVEVEPVKRIRLPREPLAVMTGFMSFPPNERAALFLMKQVWPRVREELARHDVAACRLAIVGAEPTPRIQREARATGTIVTGRVASVRDWLLRARVAIAPMQNGSGIKNKLLEACACGCPVVTTTLGASGMPTGETHGILTADSAESLARTCADLLRSPDRAAALGETGRQTMQKSFTWSAMADRLLDVIQKQVDRRSMRTNAATSFAMPATLRLEEVLADALT